MERLKTSGIVLSALKYGDTSQIVHILTREQGRQSYLVQGVRTVRGRGNRASVMQPMFLLEFESLISPKSELRRMSDVRLAYPLGSIPFDVRKSSIVLYMAEMVERLVREVEPNEALFDFLHSSVVALDGATDGMLIANFHLWFTVHFASQLGFRASNEWHTGAWFDILEGTFTAQKPAHAIAVPPENAALLWRLMGARCDELGTIGLSYRQRADFLASLVSYLGYHLDAVGKVRSLAVLAELF